MIDRRQLILGGACLLSAASAAALRPRKQYRLLGKAKLEAITPNSFNDWVEIDGGVVLQPREEGTLAAELYSQTLTRIYHSRGTGETVMLAVAYGHTQSDLLQLHRPESCYPAFGFQLSGSQRTSVQLPSGSTIPTRSLLATAPGRNENVTYWTRIGEYLPTSPSEQRADKLRIALAGHIPDGMLLRSSSIGDNRAESLQLNKRFLAELVLAIAPEHRPAFVGTHLAESIRTLRGA